MIGRGKKPLKVFISVDMEGVAGVVRWTETEEKGQDYELFRKYMTAEANAAIQGALDAGATLVVVRDAHNNACNLIPDQLHPEALLIRGWSGGPLMMMEGLDGDFDAAAFVGYHAAAGSRDAVLHHTMSGRYFEIRLNGQPMSEFGLNAAIAGAHRVPVVFLSGDRAIVEQAKSLAGKREYVIVKEGIGSAARNIHPEKACNLIRAGVKKGIMARDSIEPLIFHPPFELEIQFVKESDAALASLIPDAVKKDNRTIQFTSADLMEVMRRFFLTLHLK